jgi:hypothetical protein
MQQQASAIRARGRERARLVSCVATRLSDVGVKASLRPNKVRLFLQTRGIRLLIPGARAADDMDDREHDRHLDENADNGRERRP